MTGEGEYPRGEGAAAANPATVSAVDIPAVIRGCSGVAPEPPTTVSAAAVSSCTAMRTARPVNVAGRSARVRRRKLRGTAGMGRMAKMSFGRDADVIGIAGTARHVWRQVHPLPTTRRA